MLINRKTGYVRCWLRAIWYVKGTTEMRTTSREMPVRTYRISNDYFFVYASSLWFNMSMYFQENRVGVKRTCLFCRCVAIFKLIIFIEYSCRNGNVTMLTMGYICNLTKLGGLHMHCLDWWNIEHTRELLVVWICFRKTTAVSCWMLKRLIKSCLPSMKKYF